MIIGWAARTLFSGGIVPLRFLEPLGGGAFGDVWKAEDDLSRVVAVKLFNASAEVISSALDHARALARVTHPNVVRVLHVATANHPTTGAECQCIVMELVDGATLTQRLSGPSLALDEARSLGLSLIDGLAAIHDAGLAHGDLHSDNVMVTATQAKIIDILYRGTLSVLSSGSRQAKLRSDLTSTRIMLVDILHHSSVNPGEATQFNNQLAADASLQDIRTAWLQVTDPDIVAGHDRLVQHAIRRITDRAFVEGDAYAAAVAGETPTQITTPLIRRLLSIASIDNRHRALLRVLAQRVPDAEVAQLMLELGAIIDDATPDGAWYTPLMILAAFGRRGWQALPQSTAIRLEHLITNDLLSGRYDIYSYPNVQGGVLGTYANTFVHYFQAPDRVFDNLTSLLRQNWYTQNYVAEHLLKLLVKLADDPAKRALALDAIRAALRNDARIVKHKLHLLPSDWQGELHEDESDDDLPF
jgi:serine/threonine protein kinase